MNDEELTDLLHQRLHQVAIPAGNVVEAIAIGRRQRRRRAASRLAVAGVVAVALAGVAVLAPFHSRPGTPEIVTPTGAGWHSLPRAPISPREGAIGYWTGREAVFLGGGIENFCPPNAYCAGTEKYARDGAAYDPERGTWRRIAPAPFPLATFDAHAVVGDRLVVRNEKGAWTRYDASTDVWTALPAPPLPSSSGDWPLSAHGDRVYALADSGRVLVLDPDNGEWSVLPASALAPRIGPSQVVATPEGVVVFGTDAAHTDDGRHPVLLLAEVFADGRWTRLPAVDIMPNGTRWYWTGSRLVAPYGECLDGGEVDNFGRCIPTGGALDLTRRRWQTVPVVPERRGTGWSLDAADGPVIATWSQLYDDTTRSWTTLTPPSAWGGTGGTAAVLAKGSIIAFGGLDWSRGLDGADVATNQGWIRRR